MREGRRHCLSLWGEPHTLSLSRMSPRCSSSCFTRHDWLSFVCVSLFVAGNSCEVCVCVCTVSFTFSAALVMSDGEG